MAYFVAPNQASFILLFEALMNDCQKSYSNVLETLKGL